MAIVRAQEASSSTCAYTYDVFLSFRGEDTRKNFTDHLYTALVQAGYSTFRDDDEIEKGESLKPELDKAIKGSRISIVVFSKDYASSPWCLDELVMILRCRTSGHVVLPVFYDVRPSQIRKQRGRTGKAFARYKKEYEAEIDDGKKKELTEKVEGWKEALKEVADLVGMELKNQADGHEAKFIKKIINVIRDKLRRTPLFVSPILIGMHSRARNISKWLQDDSSEVSLLGICGMGGIGKTTIAQFVYNENYEKFAGSCFIPNVREMSDKLNGLAGLQRQLLSSILSNKHEKIYNTNEGIIKIKKAVSFKKVLLVLDDVDRSDQLHALCGMQDWFYPGSRIIVTTRYERLLKPHEVSRVEELSHDESIKLFSFYAFGEDRPIEGYTEHTERVVELCGGLPLALQVIGSSLSGRIVPQWESEVKKLEAIPHSEIHNKLKISYECLQNEDKRLFLDIACFFVGNDKDYTVKVLESANTFVDVGIQNLIERHLLRIDSRNNLMMHQLVRDMGRNIVYEQSPDELGERSRLWRHEDAYGVLENEMGTRKIKGLTLDMSMLKEDGDTAMERISEESLIRMTSPLTSICSFFQCFGCFSSFGQPTSISSRISDVDLRTDAFEKMENLRLLKLNYTHLTGRYDKFPKKLVWLCWHGFSLKSVPVELPLKNLVALDLRHSKLEKVWVGHKDLRSLKILNLSYSKRLARTPNFLGVPNLERLILKGCVGLTEICESIEFLQELDLLDLTDCKNLRKLPRNMHKLGSLETLIMSSCLTPFAGALDMSATRTANGRKWWRTSLLLHWGPQPIRGPEIFWASLPRSLKSLSIPKCNLSDDSLPSAFSNLPLLKDLDLSYNSFRNLPESITGLSSLQRLSLSFCSSLYSTLGLPSNLHNLNLDNCKALRKITFQSTPHQLDKIKTSNCPKVVEIEGILKREPIGNVNERIINNLGIDIELMENLEVVHMGLSSMMQDPIQGLYEFGIFSTFIPGGDIPSCFSERKKGSLMPFIVPSVPNFRIQCLNISTVYTYSHFGIHYPFAIKINNKTKDLTWVYSPMYFGLPSLYKDMTWLSQWNFGDQLEGGDEIVVSVLLSEMFEVKEFGIKIVYEEDNGSIVDEDNNNKTYFHWNEVVGGDLSRLELSTGTYFLCRRLYRNGYDDEEMEPYRDIFGEFVDFEEIQEPKVRCGVVD